MAVATLKSRTDPQRQTGQKTQDWLAFMYKDYPTGDVVDGLTVVGYVDAERRQSAPPLRQQFDART
jgi:hypothetical protein